MDPVEQPCAVRIVFPDYEETLLVTSISQNQYRAEESSVFGEVMFHDTFETEPQGDGSFRYLRVVTPSELKNTSWMISKTLAESTSLSSLLDRVMAVGGNWERIFGGCLIVHLPPAEFDALIPEFERLFGQFGSGNPT